MNHVELDALYDSAACLLQPSLCEGFGLPVLEAASRALSVVDSGRGALAELCPHGNSGGIIPQRFQAPLISFLDDAEYQRASLVARSEAPTRPPADFKRQFREVVARLFNSSCGSG